MVRVSIFISLTMLMMAFQNCQPAKVSAGSGETSEKLTPVVANDPEDAEGSVVQNGESEAPVDIPPADTPPADDPNRPNNPNVDADGDHFVCILEGPGKSIKLGQITTLGGQHKIPQVLCMTRVACLDIASQAFEVKGPEFRGYCKPKGNPHVVHVTDAELQAKIDAYLNP